MRFRRTSSRMSSVHCILKSPASAVRNSTSRSDAGTRTHASNTATNDDISTYLPTWHSQPTYFYTPISGLSQGLPRVCVRFLQKGPGSLPSEAMAGLLRHPSLRLQKSYAHPPAYIYLL